MKVNIKEVKLGQIVRFDKHQHNVLSEFIDVSQHLGEVVEINNHNNSDELEIHIKLKSNQFEEDLYEYNNCLIFNFPCDDCYEDVEVTIINAKGEK
tara:strand:+ start:190 stop:477 length:288 start_codon:yes stop_codon:yes gene_type:complete